MKNKILIYEDKGQKANFLKTVNDVRDKANQLISLYNEKQPWGKINTLEDFETLYNDPLTLFDRTLLANIDIKAMGGRLPDPAVLSDLFHIDRTGFMEELGITGRANNEDDCPNCKKSAQTVKVRRIKEVAEFSEYAMFLYFINGTFVLNDDAIKQASDYFNVYADNPETIALYDHWQTLCKVLNQHDKKYPLSSSYRDQICKAFHLLQLNGKFIINDIELSEQIKYMKS
jgi:hypothetical protein